MTAIDRGDGEALVSYSLETTIDVEVGWDGRGARLNGCIAWKVNIVIVCVVCARSLGGKEQMNQLDLWAQKREWIQNIVEVRRK